jgi:hypothetical protein
MDGIDARPACMSHKGGTRMEVLHVAASSKWRSMATEKFLKIRSGRATAVF